MTKEEFIEAVSFKMGVPDFVVKDIMAEEIEWMTREVLAGNKIKLARFAQIEKRWKDGQEKTNLGGPGFEGKWSPKIIWSGTFKKRLNS